MDVAKTLISTTERFPDKPAIIFKDKPISFSQLKDNSFKLANSLKKLGVKKGDKVAIYLPSCPEYIYSYLALFSIGATVVPLDFMLKEDELTSCLGHAEVKVLIAKDKQEISLKKLKDNVASLQTIILCHDRINGFINFEEFYSQETSQVPQVEINDSDPCLIMYTSGTTGKPKGILLNYRHLDGSPKAMEHFVDLTKNDVKLCALPLSHIAGLIYIQNCIVYGITLVLMERFIPLEFLNNIQKFKVTCFHIVPSMYIALLHLKEFEKYDLSSLRWLVVFGAPSSPEVLKRFLQYCPKAHLYHGWGMTETCPPNTVIPAGSDKIASVGKPSPWSQISIFDENDKELPVGSIGEIVIKGWIVMQEYYKDSETTKQLLRNGWFHTGDLGKFDADGFLYIVGRKKEMIKVGGQIVYQPEVEAAMHKHPSVAEVAVIGVSDNLRGEVPKAFVVLKEGTTTKEDELHYFCKEHLAHFKVPHHIELKSSLPKTSSGKIDKEALKK